MLVAHILLFALASPAPSFVDQVRQAAVELHSVLEKAVRDERVDYHAVRDDPALRQPLDQFLTVMTETNLEDCPRDEKLATYINIYNATVIRAVIDRYRPGYGVAEEKFKLFDEPLVKVGGQTMSLNELEHEVIRPQFQDPRAHAALVCAARSCPPLLPRAYRAEDLDKTLEENMRRFINDPSRNQIDHEKKQLRLSKIFEWYADDFGGRDKIAKYVAKYIDKDVDDYGVTFLEYSWELNDTSLQ